MAVNRDTLLRDFYQQDLVIVSESYAFRNYRSLGDNIPLITDSGIKYFSIAGIYVDYGGERGVVTMSRSTYLRHWDDQDLLKPAHVDRESGYRFYTITQLYDVNRILALTLSNSSNACVTPSTGNCKHPRPADRCRIYRSALMRKFAKNPLPYSITPSP